MLGEHLKRMRMIKGLRTIVLKQVQKEQKASIIQNVNNYHQRLKQWIMRYKGVATKYLQHYLAWFCFLDSISFDTDERSIRTFAVESCLYPTNETNTSICKNKFSA